jgi:hypothetical protein
LLNALICSLATGLFISAMSRDSQKALTGTLFLLLALIFVGPAMDAMYAAMNGPPFAPRGSLVSPGYVFLMAGRWRDPNFWSGLLASQLTAWAMLGLACWLAPRTWQERRKRATGMRGWSYSWRYGGAKRRRRLREKLLGRDPMTWLVCRERWQSISLWFLSIVVLVAFAGAGLAGLPVGAWIAIGYFSGVFFLFFYLGAASQSCRFFVEARRSGLIELLLATPLNGAEVVRGHWRALVRMFAPPVFILLCLEFVVSLLQEHSTWTMMGTAVAAGKPFMNWPLIVASAVKSIVVTGANLAALSWFGMWMGMSSRSANLATLKTILFVQIIPWLVITFVSYVLLILTAMPWLIKNANATGNSPNPNVIAQRMAWYPFLFTATVGVFSVVKDVVFIAIARNRLLTNFRAVAMKAVLPIHARPPAPPRPLPAPPPLPVKS